jgi:beta-glucosidase
MKHIILATLVGISPLIAKAPEAVTTTSTKTTHSAITPTHHLNQGWWKKRHEQKLTAAKNRTCDLLFIGDSITHGWESKGKKIWDEYYGKRNAFNIGFSGDRTEHVLWRFDHGELADFHPKAAVIMIGTNNTGHSMQKPAETAEGVKAIISKLHKHSPKTQILLLAIFPRGATADNPKRKNNDQINAILKTYDDGKTIHYLDISSVFLDKQGNLPKSIMPDRLHPNQDGYKLWAEAIEPTLKKWLDPS